MKTKTTQKIETIIEISKEDVIDMLRKTYPNIPDDAYISHVESEDGEEIVGLEVTYYETKK